MGLGERGAAHAEWSSARRRIVRHPRLGALQQRVCARAPGGRELWAVVNKKASLPLDALSGLRASLDGRVAPEVPERVGRSGGPVRRRLEAAYLATSGADALSAMIDRDTMNDMIRHMEAAEPPPPGLRDDVLGMIDGGPVADLRRWLESDHPGVV